MKGTLWGYVPRYVSLYVSEGADTSLFMNS